MAPAITPCPTTRSRRWPVVLCLATIALVAAACTDSTVDDAAADEDQPLPTTLQFEPDDGGMTGIDEVDEVYRGDDEEPDIPLEPPTPYYPTVPPGGELPDGGSCAAEVLDNRWIEHRPDNTEANNTVVEVGVDPEVVVIDGAKDGWGERFAPRVTGDFTGTTEQILRWGACKWGFDEDITAARAVTESSWLMSTAGDVTESVEDCAALGLEAPCPLSYGLLQVKGSVHAGTHPHTVGSTAFGVDYAMAWLRSCYEGAFVWLADEGYEVGDEWGCVGAWFSGHWYDEGAERYIEEVRGHLADRTWERYLG